MTELAAPVTYLVCQPTFQLTELILRKNIHLVYLGWIYLFLSFGRFSNKVCNLDANFGDAKLSFCLVHCFKIQNLFPVVSLYPPNPKMLPQFRKEKKKSLFKYLYPNQNNEIIF